MDKYIVAPPSGSTNNSVGAVDRHWQKGYFDELPNWQEYLAESTGYGIVSGCTPTISWLTVTVAAGVVHLAGGTRKEIVSTNITLDAADSTNPRIDLVYIDSTGTVAKVTGTAAANPSAPALPANGISVATVSVAAGATTGTVTDSRGMLARWYNTGIVNVKDFGAVGDGVTDDTEVFKNAISAAEASTLIVANGRYNITSNIFAENVNFVDNGQYINSKPAYKNNKTFLQSLDDISYETAVDVGTNYSAQGLCYDKKRNYVVIAVRASDSDGKIIRLNADTYAKIDEYSYSNLIHANTLTYVEDTDKIYCLTESDRYAVIDADTMQIISTDNHITGSTGNSITGLAYDNVLKLFVGLGYPNTTSNWNLYLYDSNMNLLRIVDISDTDSSIPNRTTNGICVNNGNVLILTFDYLYVFDVFGDMKNKIYYPQGRFNTSTEFEDADIVGDYIIMSENKATTDTINLYKIDTRLRGKFNIGMGDSFIPPLNYRGIDLNNYVMPGVYQIYSNNAINSPVSDLNAILTVVYIPSGTYIAQELEILGSSSYYKRYSRQRLSYGWTTWLQNDGGYTRTGNTYVEISSSEANGHYTATSNGYLAIRGTSSNLYLENQGNNLISRISIEATTNGKCVYVPMRAGQTAYFEATTANRKITFHANV